jgi:hypothetical protein
MKIVLDVDKLLAEPGRGDGNGRIVMVDRMARRRLAELLRHVVSGQINKDEFLIGAEEIAADSNDDALSAVHAAVDSLYDDVSALWSVRFRGRFRLPVEERRRLAIAALFLYSGGEYEWPPSPGPRGACLDSLLAFACGAFVFAGLMFLAVTVASAWFALVSAGCFVAARSLYRLSQRMTARSVAEWESAQTRHGDFDVWPFLKRADFEKANRDPPLLCGRP